MKSIGAFCILSCFVVCHGNKNANNTNTDKGEFKNEANIYIGDFDITANKTDADGSLYAKYEFKKEVPIPLGNYTSGKAGGVIGSFSTDDNDGHIIYAGVANINHGVELLEGNVELQNEQKYIGGGLSGFNKTHGFFTDLGYDVMTTSGKKGEEEVYEAERTNKNFDGSLLYVKPEVTRYFDVYNRQEDVKLESPVVNGTQSQSAWYGKKYKFDDEEASIKHWLKNVNIAGSLSDDEKFDVGYNMYIDDASVELEDLNFLRKFVLATEAPLLKYLILDVLDGELLM